MTGKKACTAPKGDCKVPLHLKIDDAKVQLGSSAALSVRFDDTSYIGENDHKDSVVILTVLDSLCFTILQRLPESILKTLVDVPMTVMNTLLKEFDGDEPEKHGKRDRQCGPEG